MLSNYEPFSKLSIVLIVSYIQLSVSNNIPPEVMEYGEYSQNIGDTERFQQTLILEQIIRYSHQQHSLETCATDESLSSFVTENKDAIDDARIQNEETCTSLQLNSRECYDDCIYYLSPLTLLENNTLADEFSKVLSWYQMGGGPVGWYETGNPDMCKYMDGTYCWTPIQMNNGFMNFNLQEHGCCVPGSCVGDDAEKVLIRNQWCYQGYNLTYNMLLFGNVGITNVCAPLERDLTSPGFAMVIMVFLLFLISVIGASIKTQHLIEVEEKNKELSMLKLKISMDDNTDPKYIIMDKTYNVYDNNWFLYCFSIQNLWKMFTQRRPDNKSQFNFLDGIRVASMSWVIWGHVYIYYLMSSPSNQATLMPFDANVKQYPYVFTKFYMMIAEYGFYSVDSFFYLSGFLAAFALYRKLETYGKKAIRLCYVWIPLSYLNRFVRIFPMMAFILFAQWFVADQLPYGYRVTSRETNNELCKDSWYKVLFFYANVQENATDLGCMGHLWYIQCDMQLFLILPWIILIFKWNKYVGLTASLLAFLGGIAVRTYFAIHYHFGANFLSPAHPEINDGSQQQQYFKPWTRMSPYFIGVFTMLLILTLKDKHFELKSRYTFIGIMCLSGFIMCCLVFWPYDDIKDAPEERWNVEWDGIYYALSRPMWGAALGLMSFGLAFKSNSLQSMTGTLLSAEIYQPLGKLTYTMYLIHWMVLAWFFNDLNMSTYYEFWWILSIFCAIWFVTVSSTLVLWFVMEQPLANLTGFAMRLLIKSKNKSPGVSKRKSVAASDLSELANVVTNKNKNNYNGNSVLDKLLVEGVAHSNTASASQSYGVGQCYETSYGGAHGDNEYSSVKQTDYRYE